MEEKCPCLGAYLEKFTQPAILLLLKEGGPAHGFKLLSEIKERGLVDCVDAAGFYRTLKRLNEDGKLDSAWDLTPGQKARRVYSITEKGRWCLANWQNTLHNYRRNIDDIIDALDETLGPPMNETKPGSI